MSKFKPQPLSASWLARTAKALRVYRWAVSYLIRYWPHFFLFIACGIVISFSELVIPKFLQAVVDEVVPDRDGRRLLQLFAVVIGFIAIMITLTAVRNKLQRVFSMQAGRDLQFALFRHLRRLGFAYHEQNPVGETLSLMNTEVAAVQRLYRWQFPDMVQRLFMVVLFGIVMLFMNVKLSLLAIPCFLSYYVISPYFQHLASKYISATMSYRLLYNKKIYDSISATPELRAHSAEEWDMGRLMDGTNHIVKMIVKYQLNGHLCQNLRNITTSMGLVLILWFGARDIQAGTLTVGEIIAFVLYYMLFMRAVTSLVAVITEQRVAASQAEALYVFLQQQPEVVEPASPKRLPAVEGAIEFDEVSFGYGAHPSILQRFSLHVRPGERVALVGTSGGGKSTVLKLVGRFYDPREGEVRLDGVSLRELGFDQVRSAIGFVFQDTYLFGTTVKENIRFGRPEATDEDIVAAAQAAYAHDFILQFPDGYETLVGERGIKLSGGQRQRIAIARMFLNNPSIILLDEATSALDNVSEKEVQHALERLLVGRTTLAVAHRLSTVKDYDRLILMEDGRAAESGTYEELMALQGAFYRLVMQRTHVEDAAHAAGRMEGGAAAIRTERGAAV